MSDNIDNENDNWWEEEGSNWWSALGRTPDPPGEPSTPDTTIRSFSAFTIWGDTGTIGLDYKPSEKTSLKSLLESAERFEKADELVLMLRYYAQTKDITSFIQKLEQILYCSTINTKIKNPDALTPINQLYFHMLRAYTRAKEGNFVQANMLWNDIADSWLDVVDEYRQPFILTNLFTTSLCISDWEMAIDYLERLWAIIKFMDPNKRHALGIWDEWVCCLIIHWIFLKYCLPYFEHFCDNFKGQPLFNIQKKILILEYLDISFLSTVIDESYYNRARELHPKLPKIKYKKKPPINELPK